jgi:hypothetical protein
MFVDDRPEFIAKLPDSVLKFCGTPKQYWSEPKHQDLRFTDCIVAAYSCAWDADAIFQTLEWYCANPERKILPIGLVGSQSKFKTIRRSLTKRNLDESVFDQFVRCPVGLGLGGIEPVEIALEILGDVLKRYREVDRIHRKEKIQTVTYDEHSSFDGPAPCEKGID